MIFDTLLEEGILPKKQEEGVVKDSDDENTPPDESVDQTDQSEETGEEKNEKKTKGCNTDEILAVLAHELGHWKLSHNLKNIFITEVRDVAGWEGLDLFIMGGAHPGHYECVYSSLQVNLFLTLFLFGYFMNQDDLYASFGFPDSRPVLIGLILFLQLIFIPYNEVSTTFLTQVRVRVSHNFSLEGQISTI